MSAVAELAHDLPAPTRLTLTAWHVRVKQAATSAWADTNLAVTFDTAYRLADATLRAAMPDLAPLDGGNG